ncbi:MAG TPA: YkgJ family cysteine cluster protein [Polyangiaceae bacterium]|jgi:hypothetical protein|nr:YkgJ family cysteine cluster protein [Polyangiaceae bacterium]
MDSDELPDCTECGACCFSNLPTYVAVTGDDYARLGELAETWADFDGRRAHMCMHDGHCAALRVEASPKPAVSARYLCVIYEQRPETCRTLERGSPMCAAERELKAERARLYAERQRTKLDFVEKN